MSHGDDELGHVIFLNRRRTKRLRATLRLTGTRMRRSDLDPRSSTMTTLLCSFASKALTLLSTAMSALDLLDETIAELEARLNLKPGEAPRGRQSEATSASDAVSPAVPLNGAPPSKGKAKKAAKAPPPKAPVDPTNFEDQPEICKLEFKVGVITKVWVHDSADKLYCEEIDVGEGAPRQIASGLRAHFTLEQMLGQRLLVVSNLKAKNLVGFKSHGMVLCAAATDADGSERVEFVEPPPEAEIGQVVTFAGLPPPKPLSPAQVEKRKVFQACLEGLRTTDDCVAVWNGHAFMTTAGPCKTKSIAGGCLR